MIFLLPIPVDSKSDAIGRKSFSTTISFSSRKTRIERGCRADVRLCLMAFSTNNCRQTGGICPSICFNVSSMIYADSVLIAHFYQVNIRMEESDFFFDAYRISFQILDDVSVHL